MRWSDERRVEVALARRSAQAKTHSGQGELRTAGSDISPGLKCIANHTQAFLIEPVRQLNPVGIIDIDHGSLWSGSEPPVEQALFRVPVVLHRLVIVQMSARQVLERGDGVMQI